MALETIRFCPSPRLPTETLAFILGPATVRLFPKRSEVSAFISAETPDPYQYDIFINAREIRLVYQNRVRLL